MKDVYLPDPIITTIEPDLYIDPEFIISSPSLQQPQQSLAISINTYIFNSNYDRHLDWIMEFRQSQALGPEIVIQHCQHFHRFPAKSWEINLS